MSAAGNFTSASSTSLSGTIAPGHYYLIQELAGAGGTTNLPTPDATGIINMSATTGKVALVNSTTLLTGTCPGDDGVSPFNPNTGTVVDFIGYGSTSSTSGFCYEGSGPTAVLTNTTAALRGSNGCTDTDVNSADFATGAPNPRNSATATNQCPGTIAPPDTESQFVWFDVLAFVEGTRVGRSPRNRALSHHAARKTQSVSTNTLRHPEKAASRSPGGHRAPDSPRQFPGFFRSAFPGSMNAVHRT